MEELDVLFVENEDYIADIYSKLSINTSNYTFKIVSSGEEALILIKDFKFKIFVLDINLGHNKLTGVDLSIKIRKLFPTAKIYAITGFTYLFDTISPSVAGFDAVFSKPDAVLSIVATIEKDLAI